MHHRELKVLELSNVKAHHVKITYPAMRLLRNLTSPVMTKKLSDYPQ